MTANKDVNRLRGRAEKLIAQAVSENKLGNAEAARSFALKAALLIAEHDLLKPPKIVEVAASAAGAVSPKNMADVLAHAKEAAATVRTVAADPNVQSVASAAASLVGNLVDLASKRKAKR